MKDLSNGRKFLKKTKASPTLSILIRHYIMPCLLIVPFHHSSSCLSPSDSANNPRGGFLCRRKHIALVTRFETN